jgi:hypothetical protein
MDSDYRHPGSAPTGGANADVAWRMRAARRIAEGYSSNARLAALAVSGSVGAGLADRWSDLEMDCYWTSFPTNEDRRNPIDHAGASVEAFWDYDATDQEWSEDYRLGPLIVTVSNFTVATVEQFLDAVVGSADTDPVGHMRLAAIQRCEALRGADLIADWRDRAGQYPDRLVAAMVEQSLAPNVLAAWSARDALAERGDSVALHALLSRIEQAVLATVVALNRVYQPHRIIKWQHHLIAGLNVTPDRLDERLDALWQRSPLDALANAETLLAELLRLADQHSGAELSDFREAFLEHRQPIDTSTTA